MERWTSIHPQDKKAEPVNEEKPLNVVLPCWKGDEHQAIWVLDWIAEMGMVQAPFYLLCSKECDVRALSESARKAFSMPQWLEDCERLNSNWHEKGDHPKSAAGPNSLFRQAAWFFYLPKQKGPWLFLEPDAIPCTPDWYERIKVDYKLGKKPFMGHKVTPVNHPGVPPHMSGVGVYSDITPMLNPKAISPSEVAFDIAGCDEFLRQAHFSPLIYHKYRPEGFTTQEDFDARVPKHVAIWHACKDGSIYPFLRNRLGLQTSTVTPVAAPVAPAMVVQRNEAPAIPAAPLKQTGPIVDIFIKTREHDYPWLEWCLKGVQKFTSGFGRNIILTSDRTGINAPAGWGCSFVIQEDKEPGYLWQQACKLNADQYTDADYILFMDSDCVFTRPVTPDDFIKDGKPIWLHTPLDQARPDQHVWAPVMEKFLGKKPQHEFMRRHPFIVPRWAFQELRTFCQYRHGKSIDEYILGEADPANGLSLRFSEWNCLGFFLWEYHKDRVEWVLDSDAGPACVWQGYTHGGHSRQLEDIAKFREILGEHVTQGEPAEAFCGGSPSAPDFVAHETLTEKRAIEFLASQVKDNFHKARIIRQLQLAWKGKGEAPRKKKLPAGVKINPEWEKATHEIEPSSGCIVPRNTGGALLCVHSYPGANETFERHFPWYNKSGATRIVGVGTTDGKCKFPCDWIILGENSYMKLKGHDDHLCRRLIDTLKWCLTQPEERFIIAEYDTIFLKKIPKFKGVCAVKTGGKVNGSIADSFYHNPWLVDRETAPELIRAMEEVLPLSGEYPNNSPDIFFGLAVERAQIKVTAPFKLFTRNTIDSLEAIDEACEAALEVHAIHGVKTDIALNAIEKALNDHHLALSHVA